MHSPVSTSFRHRSVGITGFYIQLYVGIEIQVPTLAWTVLCLLDVFGPPDLEKLLLFNERKFESLMHSYKRPQNAIPPYICFPSSWLRK